MAEGPKVGDYNQVNFLSALVECHQMCVNLQKILGEHGRTLVGHGGA